MVSSETEGRTRAQAPDRQKTQQPGILAMQNRFLPVWRMLELEGARSESGCDAQV